MPINALEEWNDSLAVQDVGLATEVIQFLHRPVWVVFSTNPYSSSNIIPFGISKIFREEQDAYNWLVDKMRERKHYKYKPDEELEDIASGYIHEIEVDDAY